MTYHSDSPLCSGEPSRLGVIDGLSGGTELPHIYLTIVPPFRAYLPSHYPSHILSGADLMKPSLMKASKLEKYLNVTNATLYVSAL